MDKSEGEESSTVNTDIQEHEHEHDGSSPIIISLKIMASHVRKKKHIINRLLHQTYNYKKYDKLLLSIVMDDDKYEDPVYLINFRDSHPDLIVIKIINYDWGNITNIIQTLEYIEEENSRGGECDSIPYPNESRVLYCQDNVLYPKTMVEALNIVSLFDSDNSIWGATGFNISNMHTRIEKAHGTSVEVIEAYGGVIARVGTFLPDFTYYIQSIKEENILVFRESSDIVISNYLSKHTHFKKIVNLSNKKYSFDDIWANMSMCEDSSTLCRSSMWELHKEVIYILAGWKELYLLLTI